jgi:protein MpaA
MVEPGSAAYGCEVKQGAQRLGKNHHGYLGETVDIEAVLADSLAEARQHGWELDSMPVSAGFDLAALRRASHPPDPDRPRVYLSTGIHGDEPAGPLALRGLLADNAWPANLDLWICPCLNPRGFALNRRENPAGLDLNRDYRAPRAEEIQAHTRWLELQPSFDLALCLHEDWESHGFYVYELNPDGRPSLAEEMIRRVAPVCPIDLSDVIEGRAAKNGVIRPSLDPRSRPDWPEAFYLLTHKTRLSYTLEAPSDFALPVRVAALAAAVRSALGQVSVKLAVSGGRGELTGDALNCQTAPCGARHRPRAAV